MNINRLIAPALISLCAVFAVTGCTPSGTPDGALAQTESQLYKTLDSLIESQPSIISEKEARIRVITDGMRVMSLNTGQQYQTCKRLYDEYLAFRFDSAFQYIDRCMQLQASLNDADLDAESRIAMAHILAVTGIFRKAQQMLDGIDTRLLTPERRIEYYNQLGELNLYRSEMADHTPYFQEYIDSAQYYRQLILQIAPKDSYDYIFNRATYTCELGNAAGAIRQLEQYLPRQRQGERPYSIITSTLAYFYAKRQDAAMQEHYLLLSAISDVRGAILENNSLRELSSILLARGEYTRAYRYLQQSSVDAKRYGSRLRSLQVARMAPLITRAYDLERTAAEERTRRLLAAMTAIALLLVATIGYTLSLIRKRRRDNEKIAAMNVELSRNIDELQHLNSQFSMLNSQMKEANRIKDEYIGRFLELSSNLIHRGEQRMKLLNRLARDRKLDELYAEMKSPKAINEGIRIFHQNFDTAFLNIYPDFISEVNRLMTADNHFEPSSDIPRLTTELRVLALIRLGISDNQTIADILRSSITTIYTYRSKLKSRALRKDSFEDDIRRIATY